MILLLLDFDRTAFDLSRFMHDEENAALGLDYLFEDAVRLLARLPEEVAPAIISQATIVGEGLQGGVDFQHHKFGFAPALAKLPFYVTTMNKGFLLAAGVKPAKDGFEVKAGPIQGTYEKVILVDDNAAAFKPLIASESPVVMYHLVRPGGKYSESQAPEGVKRIESLDELEL
ncbi:MAG TPA: hypothetical protein VMR98_03560 [Candidatus Polarisedimenticolaceae bacterium]|nr:hypothetical protein [Candidatus Polarisedimenticolaceae bacterium]